MNPAYNSGTISLSPIGSVRSCFQQNFSIPRQPGLAPSVPAVITIPASKHIRASQLLEGISSFSHIWVLFWFHQLKNDPTGRSMVRPPRLGGEKATGALASRSPYRPNPIGLSVVKIEKYRNIRGSAELLVSGGDFLDETPVLDLKPYIPYSDSLPKATAQWAPSPEPPLSGVHFSEQALQEISEISGAASGYFKEGITQCLSADPRPSWRRQKFPGNDERLYHSAIFGLNISWCICNHVVEICTIQLRDRDPLERFISFWEDTRSHASLVDDQ